LTLRWGGVTLCHRDDMDFGPRCERLPGMFTSVSFRKTHVDAEPKELEQELLFRRFGWLWMFGLTRVFCCQFRKIVEADVPVRPVVEAPSGLAPLPDAVASELGDMPTVDELCVNQPPLEVRGACMLYSSGSCMRVHACSHTMGLG
jgi:deoxyribodipyrimidine photo-lyase